MGGHDTMVGDAHHGRLLRGRVLRSRGGAGQGARRWRSPATRPIATSAASISARTRARARARHRAHARDLRRQARVPSSRRRASCRSASRCACVPRACARCWATPSPTPRWRAILERLVVQAAKPRAAAIRVHAALVALRPRDRGGLRRGGRAHPRLRARARDAAARRACRCWRLPEGARDRFDAAPRARRPAATRKSSTTASSPRSGSATSRATTQPVRLANPDRQPHERDAHDAPGRPRADAALQPEPRRGARARLRDRALLRGHRAATSRSSPSASRASPSAPRWPEQWGERQGPRASTSSTPRATWRPWRAGARSNSSAGTHPACHPGRCARVRPAGKAIGVVGELHPAPAAEIRAAAAAGGLRAPDRTPPGRAPAPASGGSPGCPSVRRDYRLHGGRKRARWGHPGGRPEGRSRPSSGRSKCSISTAERGSSPGRKSLALRIVMQDTDRTLTDSEVEACRGLHPRAAQPTIQSQAAHVKDKVTLTKAELADLLFEKVGLNKREAKDMVESFFEEIRSALERGEMRQALGLRQLPAARQAAAPGAQPQDRRGDSDHRPPRRHLPRQPEAEEPWWRSPQWPRRSRTTS